MRTALSMARKSVFFDLDGTLVDSRPGIFRCARVTFDALGVTQPSDEDLRRIIGPPLKKAFSLFIEDALTDRAVEIYREHYRSGGLFEASVYPGIPDVLAALTPRYRVFCVTSKFHKYAEMVLSHFHLDAYFGKIYGPDLDGNLAVKTDMLRHVVETEKIDSRDAVMIGDTHFDIEGARANDIHSIGVLWGFGREEELVLSGADMVIADPSQLVKSVHHLIG